MKTLKIENLFQNVEIDFYKNEYEESEIEASNKDSLGKSLNCNHVEREFISSEGDAESGPITITRCKQCGKLFTQFGM